MQIIRDSKFLQNEKYSYLVDAKYFRGYYTLGDYFGFSTDTIEFLSMFYLDHGHS